jgi:hypothetical protein
MLMSMPQNRNYPFRLLSATAFLLSLFLTTLVSPAAAQDVPTGHPIAHGVTSLFSDDDGNGAWRVVRDTALPSSDSTAIERALGFTLTEDEPVLVENQTTGITDLIPAGGASFVHERDMEKRSSLGSESVSYLRIGLVLPSEVNDAADGQLVFAGDSFDVPEGPRAVTLVSYEFGENQSITTPDSTIPVLVIVTQGSITLNDGSEVGDGEIIQISGGETITSGSDGASISLGLVGDQVDVEAVDNGGSAETSGEEDGTPTADQHSVTIVAMDCTNGDRETLEGCQPLPDVLFSVARGTETASSETGVTTDEGGSALIDVPEGHDLTATYASGAPEGLVPVTPSQSLDDVTQAESLTFVFVPEAELGVIVNISALDCSQGDPETLDGCAPLADVTFIVTSGDENTSGETGVTTDADGLASFDVSAGNDVTVRYDSGAPEGLTLVDESFELIDVQEDQSVDFVFVANS